ncbi:MAG: hypothetical protein ACYCQK_05855 [Acidiferrobacteraceae bacterium]
MAYTMLKKSLLTALLASVCVGAHAMQVTNMTAGSGTFQTIYTVGTTTNLVGSNWANVQNPTANLVGGFVTLGQITTNSFNGQYVYGFTSDGSTAPYGGTASGISAPVPSFSVTATGATTGTITGNLSAWSTYWNGYNANQGPTDSLGNPISVTGTWDPATGVYNLSWTSLTTLSGGGTVTGTWTMTGIATAVPEASDTAMMLVGLTLLGSVASLRRRRKTTHRL